MRRRQIIRDNQTAQKAVVSFSGNPNVDKATALIAQNRKPEDHEACPLCGRKKMGRPKK